MNTTTATTPREYWCCPDCGSTRIDCPMWVDANTNAVGDSSDSYNWCRTCEEAEGSGETKSLDQRPWSETREGKAGEPEPTSATTAASEPPRIGPVIEQLREWCDLLRGSQPQSVVRGVRAGLKQVADDLEQCQAEHFGS